ncbi:MAG: hypothetical protein WBE08_03605 [Methyloceanibacter sp.]|jgi:hypothetical protein|nr:MAG: hypothetical protein E4H18_03560 [Hyphomicrobiales bacterium]
MAILVSAAVTGLGSVAVAEPLDKESCAKLQLERKQLLNKDMQAALDRGPDWVKENLTEEAISRVRHFLKVEEHIQFRCRGGGVAKQVTKATAVPLPDRKPAPPSTASDDEAKPSQALADSAKTPPGKAKATR